MERAVCYIRVSTDEQVREGVSLAAQEDRLLAYCKMTGMEAVAVIRDEGVSGAKMLASRPGGERLLHLLTTRKATHVVALKLDRLFRDASGALAQTKAWDKGNVALHLVDMGGQSMNTGSAMGRMILTMMAGFAELERNLIAERTAAALAHKKRQKETYGPTPYGFDQTDGSLTANPGELAVVQQVQVWRTAGWSLRRIAEHLNAVGVSTKQGARWHASTVRYLLKNTLYAPAAS